MRPWYGIGALVLTCVASCGGKEPQVERVGTASSPIQGGTADTTDSFAVGIVQTSQLQASSMVAFCSGVLLAPNLVATARHCVAQLASATIDCSSSTFGSVLATQYVWVTTDPVMNLQNGVLQDSVGVSSIVVPSAANQAAVCGNDIALLILSQSIALPQYVTPTLNPPMTDPSYETTVSAIGYGVDTPTDTMGTSAGTRRIKQNVPLYCIPNDPGLDCSMLDPTASTYVETDEFISGDSTCEGDSGSGAYEQGHFNSSKWVAFGVLSRGGTSTDGNTCTQPIYSRFDAWASLITSTAVQAAAMGHYPVPPWAGGPAVVADAGAPTSPSSDAGPTGATSGNGSVDSGAPASSGSSSGAPTEAGLDPNGTDASGNPSSTTSVGCAVAATGSPDRGDAGSLAFWGLGLVGLMVQRRRRS